MDACDDEVVDDVSQCLAKHRWPSHVAAFSGIRAKRMGSRHHVDFCVELNREGPAGGRPRIETQQQQEQQQQQHGGKEGGGQDAAAEWWEVDAKSPSSKGLTPLLGYASTSFLTHASTTSGLFGTHFEAVATEVAAAAERHQEEDAVSALEAVETTERIRSILMKEIPSISEVCIQLK